MVRELHLRAASWYEANNLPEAAVEHAQPPAMRISLLDSSSRSRTQSGRVAVSTRCCDGCSGSLTTSSWRNSRPSRCTVPCCSLSPATPPLRSGGLTPHSTRREREHSPTEHHGRLLAYLRTLICRDGVEEMRLDAQTALQGLSPTSPYRPAMLHAEGAATSSAVTQIWRMASLCKP